jgi:hypothetical protein
MKQTARKEIIGGLTASVVLLILVIGTLWPFAFSSLLPPSFQFAQWPTWLKVSTGICAGICLAGDLWFLASKRRETDTDLTPPVSSVPGGLWIQRTVGLFASVAGGAVLALIVFVAYRLFVQPERMDAVVCTVLLVMAAIGAFLLSYGRQMIRNIPNRSNSAVPSAT